MATKKYLSLERLGEYDELIKGEISAGDSTTLSSAKSYTDTKVSEITNGTTVVKKAEEATKAEQATSALDAEKLGGQPSSYYAKASDIPTGALANKNLVSESDLDNDLAQKVNAAAEGNHSHSNKTVLDGITATKVSKWDNAESNANTYTDTEVAKKADKDHNHDDKYDAKNSAANALTEAKGYTDTKTEGMATTTVVDNKISAHNTAPDAHNDIRGLISELSTKVTNFLDVDDTTTDQLSEVLELIEANKGDLESLTSGKVNVSDIVNNLTTNDDKKVLSAAQGVALKGLIDALQEAVDGKANASALEGKADKATTIAGYGITDAYTKTEIDAIAEGKSNVGHEHETWEIYHSTHVLGGGFGGDGETSWKNYTSEYLDGIIDELDMAITSKLDLDTVPSLSVLATGLNMTNQRVLIANAAGKIDTSTITTTELGYLDGVKSNIQTQLDDKASYHHDHNDATASRDGFMTSAMVTKLAGIEEGANKTIVDSTLSSTSTNPVENKAVNSAIVSVTGLISTNTSSISANTDRIKALEDKVGDGFEEITSEDIQALFTKNE